MGYEDTTQLKSGFTSTTFLALLYSIIVLQPAAIWLYLAVGIPGGAAAGITSLILFSTLARFYGKQITRQEGAILQQLSGWIVNVFMSTSVVLIYQGWLRHSSTVLAFGPRDKIPNFYAPPFGSAAWTERTFLHPDWILPISVVLLANFSVLMTNIALGYLLRQIYVVQEKLPFPYHQVAAVATITLTEGVKEKRQLLSVFGIIGAFYGLIAYAIPFVSSSLGFPLSTIPLPWIDLNSLIHAAIPGASFGIGTSLVNLAVGMMIPASVVTSMLFGSIAIYTFGNALLVAYAVPPFAQIYFRGMNISQSWQQSLLYVWASPLVGIGVAAGIMPLVRRPRVILEAFRSLRAAKGILVSPWKIAALFAVGTILPVVVAHILVPDFPFIILIFLSVGLSFIFSLISARAFGVVGDMIAIPYVSQFAYTASGYKGTDIWFLGLGGYTDGGALICGAFKYMDLCDCTPGSFIKSYVILLPISMLTSFIFTTGFWRIAPIPSAAYPAVNIFWPPQAIMQLIWIERSAQFFNFLNILYGFGVVAALDLATSLLRLPVSPIGIASGTAVPPPNVVTLFIGMLVGRVLQKMYGEEWWKGNRAIVAAGLMLGEGVILTISTSIALIVKSLWAMPY